MGQGSSREREMDDVQFSGVRITPDFVAQLSGMPLSPSDNVVQSSESDELQAVRVPDSADRDAVATIRRSELLQRALERSKRVGDLLLIREEEELAAINKLADEMIEREYKAPSRERPCKAEAAACLACYEANADNPIACANAVEAYSDCAREATAAYLRSSPPES